MIRPAMIIGRGLLAVTWALACASTPANATQDPTPKKPVEIPIVAPDDWKKETIPLPPGFAPTMKLRGVEVLRFSPNMYKPDAEDFFSYAFAMRVELKPELTREFLTRELSVYYRGLSKAVMKGVETAMVPTVTLENVQSEAGKPTSRPASSGESWVGKLKWTEPFVTKKAQVVHLEIQTWRAADGKQAYVFVSASPAAKTAKVWKTLRAMRDALRAKTEAQGER